MRASWQIDWAMAICAAVLLASPTLPLPGIGGTAHAQTITQADDQTFLEGSEDIPLMDGLVAAEGGMIFDSPAGRIVESFAVGEVGRADVLAFYDRSLPALGWAKTEPGRYTREDEVLRIDFFGPDGGLTVRFTVAPL